MPLRVTPSPVQSANSAPPKQAAKKEEAENKQPLTTAEKAQKATEIVTATASLATNVTLPPGPGAVVGIPGIVGGFKKMFSGSPIKGLGNVISGLASGATGLIFGGGAGEGASTVLDGVGAVTGLPMAESNIGTIKRNGTDLSQSGGTQAKASEVTPPTAAATAPKEAPASKAPSAEATAAAGQSKNEPARAPSKFKGRCGQQRKARRHKADGKGQTGTGQTSKHLKPWSLR